MTGVQTCALPICACLGWLLQDFSPVRLIQVVQSTAVIVVALCLVSLWKQEARGQRRGHRDPGGFAQNWKRLMAIPKMRRFLWTVGLGTSAFSMQDVLLEPFGGEVLLLDVGVTSSLTALSAGGSLLAFLVSARVLSKGMDACRLAALGALLGLPAFACVIFSAPLDSVSLFRLGSCWIGFAGGLFSVGMLVTAMEIPEKELTGMVLGAWGAVQATAAGLSMALGGFLAGMMLSETEYRHQVEAVIRPFRELLLGLFFISVGMLLDLRLLLENFLLVSGLLVGITATKVAIAALVVRGFVSTHFKALRAGMVLGGEIGRAHV